MTRIAPSTPGRFPTLFLTVAMLLTATVLGWFGWNTYRSYHAAGFIRERSFRTQALQGVITHMDEVLTMSARMAAATGDPAWEQRYLHFEPLLDGAIRELMTLRPDAYRTAGAGETNSANVKLVAMEHRAFDLVRRDSQPAARAVLLSPAYEAQKQIYSDGMAKVAALLAKDAGDALRSEQRRALLNVLGVAAAVPILLIGWFIALRTLRHWRIRLAASNDHLDQQARELRELNADLDQRVAARTAELETAHRAVLKVVAQLTAQALDLTTARDGAEAANRAKASFLANMSHEIRTPMNAVLGFVEIVLDTELTAEQRQALELVQSSSESLLAILNDILDFSKIEAEHLTLESIPFDLPGVVHATANLLAVKAREKQLDLTVDIAAEVPRTVRGDPIRVRQVLTNLIGNAVKFTDRGDVTVSLRAPSHDGDRTPIEFRVRDSGVGIAPGDLASIFEGFTQADGSLTRRHGGTGLGLAISRRLVELMGGALTVTSELGQGSEFCFTLPLEVDTRVPQTPVSGAGTGTSLGGRRFLVVDDNEINRRLLREILGTAGAEVEEATGADAGLDLLRIAALSGARYDLAILDGQMPDQGGFDLAATIRSDPDVSSTRILMLTSGGQRGDEERCHELRIQAYLTKPVSWTDLLETVSLVLTDPASPARHADVVTRHTIAESRRSLRILLAEDNPVNRQVAAAMLLKRGHHVDLVCNGREAAQAVGDRAYDIVLMDIQMPEMDGFAATAAIRALPQGATLPIIAVTAHALTGERERCLARGMSGYLAKPFRAHDLFAVVEGWQATPAAANAPLGAAKTP